MLIGITGSHGFIGQNLFNSLSQQSGHQLRRFDQKEHKLLEISSLKPFVEGLDLLYHIAGANRAENSELLKVNTLGTSNLLEAVKRYGKPDYIRIVYISSFQVYSPMDTEKPVLEDTLPDPKTVFGVAKRCSEDLIRISGLNSDIIRISNVYGPHCRPFYNSVISTFCELICKGREITINGDGSQTRDFIFIHDVVSALGKFIQHQGRKTEIYNLCGGELTSLNTVIDVLEKVSGKKVQVNYNQSDDPNQFLCGDNQKISKTLDWRVENTLEEGIEKTYKWFENRK